VHDARRTLLLPPIDIVMPTGFSRQTVLGWIGGLVVVLMGLSPRPGATQEYVAGARPAGIGQAFTSIATGPSGIYHNPAGIPMANMYAVGGNYQFQPSGSLLNASVVDSKTNPKVTAGAGYSYLLEHGDSGAASGHDIRLAFAVPALEKRFSVGIGGRYLILDDDGTEFARGFTLDGGVIVRILENLHAGVAGKNLVDIRSRPVRGQGVAPRTVAGGLSYGLSTAFQFSSDIEFDLNSEDDLNLEYQIGAEYMAGGSVPLRIGYRHLTIDASNHVTGGIGWRSARFGADASVDINVNDISSVTAATSFAIYFN